MTSGLLSSDRTLSRHQGAGLSLHPWSQPGPWGPCRQGRAPSLQSAPGSWGAAPPLSATSWRPAQLSSVRPPNPGTRASPPPHLSGAGPRLWEEGTCDWGLKSQARLEMRLGSLWKPLCSGGARGMFSRDGVGCWLGGEGAVGRQGQEQGPFLWAGGTVCWLGSAVA